MHWFLWNTVAINTDLIVERVWVRRPRAEAWGIWAIVAVVDYFYSLPHAAVIGTLLFVARGVIPHLYQWYQWEKAWARVSHRLENHFSENTALDRLTVGVPVGEYPGKVKQENTNATV